MEVGTPIEPVDTHRWGRVWIRPARATDIDRLMDILAETTGAIRLARLCVFALVDETGKHLLTDDDIPKLIDGPLEPLQEVAVAFLDACGLDETKKNSPMSTTSSTASPGNGDSRTPKICSH